MKLRPGSHTSWKVLCSVLHPWAQWSMWPGHCVVAAWPPQGPTSGQISSNSPENVGLVFSREHRWHGSASALPWPSFWKWIWNHFQELHMCLQSHKTHACACACAAHGIHFSTKTSAMSNETSWCRPHQVISCCLGSHLIQWSLEFRLWHWYLPFLSKVPHCTWGQKTLWDSRPQQRGHHTQMPWISPILSTMSVIELGPVQLSSLAVSSEAAWLDAIEHRRHKCNVWLISLLCKHVSTCMSSCCTDIPKLSSPCVEKMLIMINCLRYACAGLHWRHCWSQAFDFT